MRFREDKNIRYIQENYIKLTRSFLSFTESNNTIRPLLNNEEGHITLKNMHYIRSGSLKTGGHTTTLYYKDIALREINTTKISFKK